MTSPNIHFRFLLVFDPHNMPALVQRPAPTFKADAVANGEFIDVSLSNYLGKWCVLPVAFAVHMFVVTEHRDFYNKGCPPFLPYVSAILSIGRERH